MDKYYAEENNGKCTMKTPYHGMINFDLIELAEFVNEKGWNVWFDDGRKIEFDAAEWLNDDERWPFACETYYKEIICSNIEIYNEDFYLGCYKIRDKSVSILFLDLPYGTTQNKWDVVIDFVKVWGVANRILKPNGVVIFTAAGMFTAKVIMSMPHLYKYSLVWQKTTKTNFLNTKKQFLRSHEDIVIFYDKQPTFNPIITTGHKRKVSTAEHKRNSKMTTNYREAKKVGYNSTDRYSGSVLTFPNDKQKSSINPTQKPVALLEQLFSVFSNEGDLIVDLTAGSFSSAVAAKILNRKYVGFEIDENQFNQAKERIFK